MSEWIMAKDRLPEEEKLVLVARKFIWHGHKLRYVEIAERVGSDWTSDSDHYHTAPYAWMPLPEPPEEVDERCLTIGT